MGTWGTNIGSNDEFCEVYDEFFSLYNQGYEIKDIREALLENYKYFVENEEISNEFWFALAKAEWECKELEQSVYKRVEEIINTDKDLKIWSQLDATEKDVKNRKKALTSFLKKISNEKEVAKKRKKIKDKPSIFEKGDCLIFRMNNCNYGGAVIFDVNYSEGVWLFYIAKTKIDKSEKPDINDFKNGEVLVVPYNKYGGEEEEIRRYYPSDLKKGISLFEVIGNLKIVNFRRYEHNPLVGRFTSYKELIEVTEFFLKYFEQGNKPRTRVFLSNYLAQE